MLNFDSIALRKYVKTGGLCSISDDFNRCDVLTSARTAIRHLSKVSRHGLKIVIRCFSSFIAIQTKSVSAIIIPSCSDNAPTDDENCVKFVSGKYQEILELIT